MWLICWVCKTPLTRAPGQRHGIHEACQRTQHVVRLSHLRLMVLSRTTGQPWKRPWVGAQAYLLTLAHQGHARKASIVGRCWIERSNAPATRPIPTGSPTTK